MEALKRLFSAPLAVAVLLAGFAQPAAAITARDVMEKMEQKQRFGYLTGLIDMMSYQVLLAGDRNRAECISKAYYGKQSDMDAQIFATFSKYPDRAPEALLVVLMKRACGG